MKYFKLFLFIVILSVFACNTKTQENNKEIEKTKETIESISKLIRETPKDASLFEKRALLYHEKLDMDNAINDMKISISLDSTKEKYFNTLAQYLLEIGKSGKSKDVLERCLKIYPENVEALISLAQIHLYVKQYRKSMDLLQKAQEIDENNDKIFFIRGVVFQETNDTIRAIKSYIYATEKNPQNYNAYVQLGLLFYNSLDSVSIQYFNNAININPTNVEAYYDLAMYYQINEHYKQAINTYTQIIEKVDNTYPLAYYNIGYIYLEIYKDYDNAIEFFTNASNLRPQYIDAIFNIGLCYEKKHDVVNALKFYSEVLKINPDYTNAITACARIK